MTQYHTNFFFSSFPPSLSVYAACIAAFIDSILAAHFSSLDACGGQDGEIYGNSAALIYCMDASYSCYCTDGTNCFGYDLNSGYNCGMLMDEVPENLGISALLALVLLLVMFIYGGFACGVACCPTSCGHYDPNRANVAVSPVNQNNVQMQQPVQMI